MHPTHLENKKMSQHKFHIYRFQPYNIPIRNQLFITNTTQTTQNYRYERERENDSFNSSELTNLTLESVHPIPPWRPSSRLKSLHTRFKNTILYQHPCIPCIY